MQQLENDLEKTLKRFVTQKGGVCLKFVSPGTRGVPDRMVIWPTGRVDFIELKRQGFNGEPSALQVFWIHKLTRLKQNARVIRSFSDILELVRDAGF